MIRAEEFILGAKQYGFGLYTGVPCSFLKPFINYVIDSSELRYVGAANEGDAVAIAAGAELAGVRSVVMLQNSGLGNAVNPLTSLTHTSKIPILLIVTLRGELGGAPDEPQHELMGEITTSLLDLMQIPWEYFPVESEQIQPTLQRALEQMTRSQRPYALVMKKGSVESYALKLDIQPKPQFTPSLKKKDRTTATSTRQAILQAIQAATSMQDIIVATTGFCGRELYALGDRNNQFYLVGSMGCASSLGLGLALAQPHRRIVVVDGDGAALMRLGAMTTIGYERPANLCHILLDNQRHESTGGQSTVSHSIDFCSIAAACGYEAIAAANTPDEVNQWLKTPAETLSFLHVAIKPGSPDQLPRPTLSPAEVAQRLRRVLQLSSIPSSQLVAV